ncbi:hypothetical protein BDF14DRAFT_1915144 [Spinellus fusiger]|nr:hypothetical protein BDF14DRAFT_1915144 [Spinellus fusiger]
MLPSNTTMDMARSVLTEHIDAQIERLESYAASALQPSSGDKKAPFACQFHMYGQLHPVPDPITASELEEYEKELEDPQGIDTIPPPSLHLTHVLYSPNCGLSLAMDRGRGIRIEKYFGKAIAYACMATAMTIGQIFLLIHQVEYTPTPSSVTNVSYLTIIMQAIMDGYLCLLHLTAGIVIDTVFLPFAATSFFGFILVSVFGMRYLLVIWRIQRPETTRPTRPTRPTDADVGTDADAASSLPLQHENPPSTEPESALSSTTQLTTTTTTTTSSSSTTRHVSVVWFVSTSPAFIQNIAIAVLGFTFYSFWVPQIIRNISRGCRRPLSPRYVLGMSVTRLAIPLYFYGCPENILAHKPTPWIWCLVAYVFLQVFVLFLQDALGPRFFVPERFLPQTYNYHPVLTAEDEETVQGENTVTEGVHSSPSKDCAICMLPVEMTPHGSTMNVLGRVHYMVTPCHHMFHTDCLEKVIHSGSMDERIRERE